MIRNMLIRLSFSTAAAKKTHRSFNLIQLMTARKETRKHHHRELSNREFVSTLCNSYRRPYTKKNVYGNENNISLERYSIRWNGDKFRERRKSIQNKCVTSQSIFSFYLSFSSHKVRYKRQTAVAQQVVEVQTVDAHTMNVWGILLFFWRCGPKMDCMQISHHLEHIVIKFEWTDVWHFSSLREWLMAENRQAKVNQQWSIAKKHMY